MTKGDVLVPVGANPIQYLFVHINPFKPKERPFLCRQVEPISSLGALDGILILFRF